MLPEELTPLTLERVAEMLGVSEDTVGNYINDGLLVAFHVGGRGPRKVLLRDVIAFIEKSREDYVANVAENVAYRGGVGRRRSVKSRKTEEISRIPTTCL